MISVAMTASQGAPITEQVVTGLCDLVYLCSRSSEQRHDKSQVLRKSFDI